MVEMVETAHILHNATRKSLIIMDEIGRGTSTYDGISIAWAVAEHLVKDPQNSPKTLFATHYHELQQLEEKYPNKIKNFHMAVIEEQGEPVFLHTLKPNGASSSFGIAVAKLAGIPHEVIECASEMLTELEQRSYQKSLRPRPSEIPNQMSILEHFIAKELNDIDIHQMTPLEALNKLANLKSKLKLLHEQDGQFLKRD
jgi:DNA mismatch repair protein MutS